MAQWIMWTSKLLYILAWQEDVSVVVWYGCKLSWLSYRQCCKVFMLMSTLWGITTDNDGLHSVHKLIIIHFLLHQNVPTNMKNIHHRPQRKALICIGVVRLDDWLVIWSGGQGGAAGEKKSHDGRRIGWGDWRGLEGIWMLEQDLGFTREKS